MDYDALSSDQRKKYHAAVSTTHHRRVELEVLTKNDDPVRSFNQTRFLGGSINGDTGRTPVEVLEVQVLDDDYALDWRHGQHRKYKARVTDSRFIPELDDWVECVVFTGPLWDFERNGSVVSLVAQGNERLAMGSVRSVFHRPRKAKATAVIRDLLSAAGAPARGLKIPRMKSRLPGQVTVGVRRGKRRDTNGKKKGMGKDNRPKVQILKVGREDTYWGEAHAIAGAVNRDLFSDNRGRYVMAPPPSKSTAKLNERHLIAPPTEKRGTDAEVTNTWVILGKDPKGPKKQVRVEMGLPKKHPLSAHSLAWHGSPYQVTEVIENEHLKRKAQAIKIGKRLRDAATRELVEYEVSALPIVPWIRPDAMFSIPTAGGNATVRCRQWTLPLGPDAAPMTLGANRRSGWR